MTKRACKRAFALFVSFLLILSLFVFSGYAEEAKVFHKSESGEKRIALTFDDGPHPRITRKILEVLDEFGISSKATFFVIGQNVQNYPEAMKLIIDSGCEIGNHTFSHKNVRQMNRCELEEEFEKCRRLLSENFSVEPTLLRPPEGFCSEALYSMSDEKHYNIILWSIDTLDWAHTPSDQIAKNVLGNAKGGDIVLMHDYVAGSHGTCDALRIIIPELLERGFEFVTVSELIKNEI